MALPSQVKGTVASPGVARMGCCWMRKSDMRALLGTETENRFGF
jgi:hypothetical protein